MRITGVGYIKAVSETVTGCAAALELRPNVLALSCAAPIDRESIRTDSNFQNRPDLARRAAASATAPGWAAYSTTICRCNGNFDFLLDE